MNPDQDWESFLAASSDSLKKTPYLANFLEITFDAVIAFDSQEQITFWNPAAERMYGWTASEAAGKTPAELFWPVNTPRDQEEQRKKHLRLERGESVQGEYRPCRKDGSLFWVEYTARAIYDGHNRVSGYLAVYRDTTEKKRTENEIRLMSRMRAENPNPVMRLTLDGKVLYANDASTSLLEFWKQQAGQPIPDELQKHVAEVFASGIRKVIEIEHNERTLSCTLAPIREAGYVNFYGSDITGRKRVERELARERELLERLFESIPVMLTIYEPSTNLLRLNSQFERLTGWSSAEAAGLSLMEACYPDPGYRQQVRQFMAMCVEDKWMDIHIRTRDGRTLETSWSNIRLSNDMQVGIGIDITERKLAEVALTEYARQQEALYKLADQLHRTNSLEEVYQAALDAIINALQCDRASILLFDASGIMRFVAWRGLSDDYRKITQGHSPWKPEEEDPEPVCVSDIGAAELSDTLKAAIEREGIRSLAFIPLVSNGKLIGKFMVYFNQLHVFFGDELDLGLTIAHQLAFGVDRKRAEEQWRESEERYRAVVESQSEMLCRFRPDGTILFVNGAYARARGTTPEELINCNFWEFVTRGDQAAVRAILDRLTPEAPEVHIENRFQTVEGERWTLWTNRGLKFDANGHWLEAQSSGIDITERKRAEEALRQSEDRFRTLANTVPSIVWTAAPDGKILYSNQQWYEYTGISPEQNAREWPVVLHPDDYERCVSAWTHALETIPDEYLIEVRNRRYDGVYRWFQTRAVPARDGAGNVIAWYGVTTDIHERIEDEKRLALLAEISELMRKFEDPDELLYTVSEAVGEHLQVKRCLFNEVDLENDRETVRRDYCRGVESVAGVHKISDYSRITSAEMRAGKTVVNYDSKLDPRTAGDYERTYAPNGERAYVAVPMMRESRWVASLWVSDEVPRMWSKDDVFLLESIAERTWTVIEKLRIAEKLRAKEAELEEIINQTPFMLTRCTRDLRYRFVSRAYAQMIGRTPEEVAGKPIVEIMGEEGLKTISPYVEKVLQGERVEYETEVSFQNVGAPFLHVVYTPDRDEHGNVIGWFASIVDITARKRAEEEVRASEALYRTIARSIPGGGVYVVDKDYRYLVAEGPVTEAFELSREMLEGHTVSEIFPTAVGERMKERLQRNFAGETVSFETKHNGRVYWTQQAPLRGSIGHAIVVSLDITERKQAEEALRQSEERFAQFMQHLPGLAWIKDVQGRYVYANAAAEQAFRTPRENLYGKTDYDIFPLEVADQFKQNDDRALTDGKGFQTIETLEHDDGVLHYSLVSKFPIPGPDGTTTLIGGIAFDITERKRAEEALYEHRKQLQQLNETLEQRVKEQTAEVHRLASDLTKAEQRERHRIAHILHDDLQQRLYAIKMQMVPFRDALESMNMAVKQDFEEISEQLDDVLALTRHLSIDLSPPILHDEGLAQAIGWLASQMQEQHGLRIDLQADGSFAIPDDDMQVLLYNCVHELLFNIVKHASVNQAVVTLQRAKKDLRIEVRDEGKGFDIASLGRRPNDGDEEGERPRSSFGLPTLRHRLSLFGGRMDIQSQPDAGTLVTMTIPVYKDE